MSYLFSIVLAQGIGGLGALFTSSKIATWYETLLKPTWTPPGWVFGPIWTTLYLLMAIAAARIWNVRGSSALVRGALVLYGLQLLLNLLWSVLFFGLESPAIGLLGIVLLWIVIVATIIVFWRIDTISGVLLLPYIMWVSIAMTLNYRIFVLN
ncbi:MAG: tryptophan-rich sensory protein [Candidatus Pacebacteria bacterium]|nr:tryptophan-rich sensory protein [Candidatus Paceibacterota bacterium]